MTSPSDDPFPDSVRAVIKFLDQAGISFQVRTFEEPAQRAAQAARLLGCPLGAVVKSLIFQGKQTGELLLVLVSGANRADAQCLSTFFGQETNPAHPRVVEFSTGYPVGAVPPVGFSKQPQTLMDQDLMDYPVVWASAGAVHTMIGMAPENLVQVSQAQIMAIRED